MDVKTAARVLDVLNLFAEARRPLIYSEIARRMDIPLSSCHGLLKTMVAKGYLYAPGIQAGYYPTQRLLHIAQAICREDPLIRLLQPMLIHLRDASNETAILAKLAETQVVYLDVSESHQAIRYSHAPGGFKLLHATASGKALLGSLSAKERGALLDELGELQPATANTITARRALEQDISDGQQRGWYRSFGENVEDVAAIAKSFVIQGEAFAFVVAGPMERIRRNEATAVAALVEVEQMLPPNLLVKPL
jgi:IclR family acetate operon transcriptional repressor